MTSSGHHGSAAGRAGSAQLWRLSSDGRFANGVTATAVMQFIYDYDGAARIEDVADWFHLEVEDVAAALRYDAAQGERMRASGQIGPNR
jgi:hypothetical protein